ncbi:ribonuclease Y [bacterium]|nr:ribonuclease Y [bacterium]NCQ54830.1 ribonuclease Y [Candidatus Parcubacteria bacterium]NCS66874.1 ribonuclease Y [Candidatus Peregrinibacteria bacterium]NCS95820.1 ribonuclease Y [bacterium]
MDILYIILALGGVALGAVVSYLFVRPRAKLLEETAKGEAERIRRNAETEAERILDDGRKYSDQLKETAKREENQMRERLQRLQEQADERLVRKEEQLEVKVEKAEKAREEYQQSVKDLDVKKEELQSRLDAQNKELEKIAQLKKEEAKDLLLARIEEQCELELADSMRRKIESIEKAADEEGSNIIVQSIQRFASNVTSESTVTVVKIDSDDIKGKIIGREGRNINAFEMLTGVDVIVDDTPGTITLSSYDTFRRFIAKIALENLVKDGRIHPSKIEEAVQAAESKGEKLLIEIGQKAALELGVSGLPEAILKLVGKLRFRSSYGQNVLQHSIEVAYLAEGIAHYLPGADAEMLKKAGLLHDIGKAVSHEVEGGHAVIGMEILQKFGIEEPVVTAMKSHHEDFPYESLEARILQAADAISASRPGARRETMEKYIKRLKELEAIAGSFKGVEKVFAIQAGREVRVFVNSQEVTDVESEKLALEIAQKVEQGMQYPGQVKVIVIRDARFEGVAR